MAEWLTKLFERFPPKSFGLADQDIVNRYGMEHPERIALLQCNVDVQGICRCDIELHPPIVLHGTGGRFERKTRRVCLGRKIRKSKFRKKFTCKSVKDQKFWHPLANAIDKLFELLQAKGHESLPGSSIWEAVGHEVRFGIAQTIGFHRNRYGSISPRIDLPPLGPMANASNYQLWKTTYLEKVFNVTDVFANMPTETREMYMAREADSQKHWASIRR